MKVAFFLRDFPVITQTYIIQEILGFYNDDIAGKIFTFNKYNLSPDETHPYLKTLYKIEEIDQKSGLFDSVWRDLQIHIKLLALRPVEYLKLVKWVLSKRSTNKLWILKNCGLIAHKLIKGKFTHIHAHLAYDPTEYSMIISRLSGIPYGFVFHIADIFRERAEDIKEKVEFASYVIFRTKYSMTRAIERYPEIVKYKSKFIVLAIPGVNTRFFSPVKRHIHKKKTVFLSVGRLEETKGYSYLIDACSKLAKKGIDFECRIIGTGSLKGVLRNKISIENLSPYVKLVGAIVHGKKLIRELRNADIFILPSVVAKNGDRDVLPNALLEAMSSGLMVVTTSLGGISELIESEKNGFLVKPRSVADLERILVRLIKLSEKDKKAIGKLARQKVLDKYDYQKTHKKLVKIIKTSTLDGVSIIQ